VNNSLHIELLDWSSCHEHATRIRHAVFVEEQGVPIDMELDADDETSIHALAFVDSERNPVGTGRLLPDAHIGRLAVLPPYRGRHIGSALLAELVDEARRRGHVQVALAAQVHALDFYTAHGFRAQSDVFLDCDIEHVAMVRTLTA
jgi:predicted GNAT family N-acyltransferase